MRVLGGVLVALGVILWVVAASVDRVVNGGEALALVLIVAGIVSLVRATRS